MEFDPAEAIFYAVVFVAAGAITLFRVWRDNERLRGRALIGRSLSAGSVTFGIVALLIGRSADPSSDGPSDGGFYWLAIAALIAYYWKEIEEKALKKIIDKVVTFALGVFGIKDGKDDVGK